VARLRTPRRGEVLGNVDVEEHVGGRDYLVMQTRPGGLPNLPRAARIAVREERGGVARERGVPAPELERRNKKLVPADFERRQQRAQKRRLQRGHVGGSERKRARAAHAKGLEPEAERLDHRGRRRGGCHAHDARVDGFVAAYEHHRVEACVEEVAARDVDEALPIDLRGELVPAESSAFAEAEQDSRDRHHCDYAPSRDALRFRATPPKRPAEVHRLVSLLPSFTETVVALGHADLLVGCTEAGRPGRDDVTRLPWRPSVESVIRLRPDVVLRQKSRAQEDTLRAQLEAAGIYVLAIPSETIADVRRAITEIGELLDRADEAKRIVSDFDRELESVRRSVEDKRRPSVLFVFGRDQGAAANIRAAGPNTFLDELITLAGGRNVLADIDHPYPDVALADLVRRKPEVIIDNLPAEKDLAAVRNSWSRLTPVPAVRDGNIHAVFDRDLLIPGPRLPAGLARLAKMIHGED